MDFDKILISKKESKALGFWLSFYLIGSFFISLFLIALSFSLEDFVFYLPPQMQSLVKIFGLFDLISIVGIFLFKRWGLYIFLISNICFHSSTLSLIGYRHFSTAMFSWGILGVTYFLSVHPRWKLFN